MTIARIARARRLLAVETERVGTRERELSVARRANSACETAAAQALADARAADTRWLLAVSVEELAWASDHRRALEVHVTLAALAVVRAAAEVRAREVETIAARIAARRFELLIEGFLRADSAIERRLERRSADEHASRRREST